MSLCSFLEQAERACSKVIGRLSQTHLPYATVSFRTREQWERLPWFPRDTTGAVLRISGKQPVYVQKRYLYINTSRYPRTVIEFGYTGCLSNGCLSLSCTHTGPVSCGVFFGDDAWHEQAPADVVALVKMYQQYHLFSIRSARDIAPIHGLANAWYWYGGTKWALRDNKKLAAHLGITSERAAGIPGGLCEAELAYYIDQNFAGQWAADWEYMQSFFDKLPVYLSFQTKAAYRQFKKEWC